MGARPGCEFDCCECGAHVIRFDTDSPPAPSLCAQCLFLPGWHTDPKLRAIFGRQDVEENGCGNG